MNVKKLKPVKQVEILILAAGKSSRMDGRNKLLEPLNSSTLLEHVVKEALNSKTTQVSVILPTKKSKLWDLLEHYPVDRLLVQDSQVGMGYSISCGMINIKKRKSDGVLILLADMPEIKCNHLDFMIQAFNENSSKSIIRATSKNKPGNPVLFSSNFYQELAQLKGDSGAKKIIIANQQSVLDIALPGNIALIDLDTPEQWKAWKKKDNLLS